MWGFPGKDVANMQEAQRSCYRMAGDVATLCTVARGFSLALALAVACKSGRKASWTPILMPDTGSRTMPDDGFIPMGVV